MTKLTTQMLLINLITFVMIVNAQQNITASIDKNENEINKQIKIKKEDNSQNINNELMRINNRIMQDFTFVSIIDSNSLKIYNEKNGNKIEKKIKDELINTRASKTGRILLNKTGNFEKGKRKYEIINTDGSTLEEGNYEGEDLLLSPDGMYMVVSRPDELEHSGKLKIKAVGDENWNEIKLPDQATYFTNAFVSDNYLITIAKCKNTATCVLKYNTKGEIILKKDIQKETGLNIFVNELTNRLTHSPNRETIALLGILPEATSSVRLKNIACNTIIIIDSDLNIKTIVSQDMHYSSISFINEMEIMLTSMSTKYLETENASNWDPTHSIVMYNITDKSVVAKGNGNGRHLGFVKATTDGVNAVMDNGQTYKCDKKNRKIELSQDGDAILVKTPKNKIVYSNKYSKFEEAN